RRFLAEPLAVGRRAAQFLQEPAEAMAAFRASQQADPGRTDPEDALLGAGFESEQAGRSIQDERLDQIGNLQQGKIAANAHHGSPLSWSPRGDIGKSAALSGGKSFGGLTVADPNLPRAIPFMKSMLGRCFDAAFAWLLSAALHLFLLLAIDLV